MGFVDGTLYQGRGILRGMEILPVLAGLVLGGLAWPLIEYAVHGVLSHRLHTFVTPLHAVHHKDPRAVFTSPLAWIPATALVAALATWVAGTAPGLAFTAGALSGFFRYEYVHWRIHFRLPRNEREARMRAHHLAHHYCDPRSYHGVTTRFWDRVLGTLPAKCERDYARAATRAPLDGASNLGRVRPTRV